MDNSNYRQRIYYRSSLIPINLPCCSVMTKGLEMDEVKKTDSKSEALKADTIANETLSEEILLSKTT